MTLIIKLGWRSAERGGSRPKGYANVLGFPKSPQLPIKIDDFEVIFVCLDFSPKSPL